MVINLLEIHANIREYNYVNSTNAIVKVYYSRLLFYLFRVCVRGRGGGGGWVYLQLIHVRVIKFV